MSEKTAPEMVELKKIGKDLQNDEHLDPRNGSRED